MRLNRHHRAPSLERGLLAAALLGVAVASTLARTARSDTTVRVWEGSVQLPTYAEGPANPNPPFDLFSFGRFNYPYPIRDALTNQRELVRWRSLHLENEYLRLTVLPDLGGHIYSCLDKRTGREMFYANASIKKALIGYRGAWAAFGVEFNFPVSHNWVSMSPVDFAISHHPDGSGSIWVGNTDQVYGSHWRVQLRLTPGRSVLDQDVDLYNASDVRHRYYWWSNGAVQVWDDSRLLYPTELMATHGFTRVEPWPIDSKGRDLSVIRNQIDGPVSLFTHGTREGFVGVYHPRTNSGTVHLAAPAEVPFHKVWSWGNDREAAAWRGALSDDDSGYVELQAGLFRNQETYAFLEPQEAVRFSEHWLPVRDLGGITRATIDAVLHMERATPTRVRLALDVTRNLTGARVRVWRGDVTAIDTPVTVSPREVWRTDLDEVPAPVTFELTDVDGRIVLHHTEGVYDRTPASPARPGPQPDPRRTDSTGPVRSVADDVEWGEIDELEGRRLQAMARYRAGLETHPHALALLKAAGRLAVALGWAEAQAGLSSTVITWLEAAHARNTTDFEVRYYLGVALAAAGRPDDARAHLEAAQRFRATRTAATLQLARLLARDGQVAAALQQLAMAADSPRSSLLGTLEVSILRRLGRHKEARERAQHSRTIDPTSSAVRYELTLIGESDPELWLHLAADANRVLDLVDQYLAIGGYADALGLLEYPYSRLELPMREPGAVLPHESPLVAYYRGYVREQLGRDGGADYAAARSLPATYVFPSRRSSYRVLKTALQAKPDDPIARFLLGALYLASGLSESAAREWQHVRHVQPPIPTLHRNLGLTLLRGPGAEHEARAVLQEGIAADSANVDVYLALDDVLSAVRASPRERVAALRRFPTPDRMPSSMAFKLALALAEAGEERASERLFHDRFFPREEGGTSVRAVYVQVRLTSARMAAEAGNCAAALEILDSFPHEQPELAFTSGGLADALQPPAMARQVATIESVCGRRAAARSRWERLEGAIARVNPSPMAVAVGDEARRRLGTARTPDQRRRLESALDSATRTLESASTNNPGLMEYARGLLLAALGRGNEAGMAFRRVFRYPDRALSHALARTALRTSVQESAR
jgi:tetratricopeptide (TPR) repeat protein